MNIEPQFSELFEGVQCSVPAARHVSDEIDTKRYVFAVRKALGDNPSYGSKSAKNCATEQKGPGIFTVIIHNGTDSM